MWLTLFRNFGVALVWTHFAACFFYFIARQYDFAPDNTWIGSLVEDLNGSERYLTSLYWAVITFTTVGYGDFSPVNSAEQIWGMVYMLLNMIIQAWFIGSITLIIVKGDEETNEYRDTVHILNEYSALHSFDRNFRKRLVAQLKLVYNSREISDEQVLKPFPSSVRRKVLRRLYLQPLLNTSLMKGIREQFVDAFLTTCNVEIFSPGEEVLHRGSISSDLYLLVEGVVKLLASSSTISENYDTEKENTDPYGTSIADSEMLTDDVSSSRLVNAGEFINEIGFFTETPQTDTVRTLTIW
jgi:CRP-like cAMP-binding protein